MSMKERMKILEWIWRSRASSTQKLILSTLAVLADDDATCVISQTKLGRMLSLGQDTVSRNVRQLEELGLLRRERMTNPDGSRSPDRYEIPLEVTFK